MRKIKVLIALIIFSLIAIPKVNAYEIGREVYIRHIDKDGGAIIGGIENAEQVLKDSSGNLSLVGNSNSIDVPKENYSEYYAFDLDKTMTISKSMVVLKGGYNYTYLGYVRRTDVSYDVAMGYAENARKQIVAGNDVYDMKYSSTDNSTTLYNFGQKNENDVTIIDFYYSKSSTEDISVKLYTRSSATPSDSRLNTTEVTYVPASAFLHPYYEAPSYYATELTYKKIIENNEIKYDIENYTVNIATSGTMHNSGSIYKDGKEIRGNVIGTGNEFVISGTNDELVTNVISDIRATIRNLDLSPTKEVENYNTKQNQKLITGDNLNANNFQESDYAVNFNGYNGLRSAKGKLTYTSYNVKTGENTGGTIDKESTNEHFINLYTPIKLDIPEVVITSEQEINHSNTSATTVIMGDDATFEIRMKCSDSNFFQGVDERSKARFVDYYYLVFDFDVIHNNRLYTKGNPIRMTNTSELLGGVTYFRGQVAPNETLSRDNSNHKIIVIAEASNAPKLPKYEGTNTPKLLQLIANQEEAIQVLNTKTAAEREFLNDSGDNEANFSTDLEHAESHTPAEYTGDVAMYSDGYYYAMRTVVVRTVSRIYDLRITDCTDLAFKSVFRNSNNELIGNNYFSGTRRMLVYLSGNREHTSILTRENDDLYIYGTSSTKTLPLGPYKHNTATYTKAPKLGYRIAFDLKTSGFYMADGNDVTSRKIIIKPSYYYISKDGNTLIKDIDLYYRDQSDKYRNFEGSNYTIYFTPNDGYRLKGNSTTSNLSSMSTQSIALNLGSSSGEFYLTDYMMSSDDTNYIQSWYGEFKLPNTTIAVRKGGSLNDVLSDGYIGVKFDITCSDTILDETISYSSPNKNATSQVNTTQWDYEGYLGFANPGQPISENSSLRMQLEKGIWVIRDQETYDFVKGTIVLFDTDDRASDDIQ